MFRSGRLVCPILALAALVHPLAAQVGDRGPTLPVALAVSVGADLLDDLSMMGGGPAPGGRGARLPPDPGG